MRRIAVVMILSMMFTGLMTSLAPGQEIGPSNGKPDQDTAAVAELARARELYAGEDTESEVISILLPLVERFEATEDWDSLVDCVFLIGDAYYHVGDWERAEKFMKIASDLGYRLFADAMSTYPLKVIGECQFEQGKKEEALATFQTRVDKLRASSNQDEMAGALFDVGAMLINNDKPEEAVAILKQARSANIGKFNSVGSPSSTAPPEEKDGVRVDQAEIIYHTAIAYFHMEDMALAAIQLEQAYDLFSEVQADGNTDVSDRLVAVLDDLVMVSEQQGQTEQAEKYRAERDKYNN